MEEACPLPIHMISLLAFRLPYVPPTNDKYGIVGSASSTPAVVSFLQGAGKQEWVNRRLRVAEEEVKR